MADKFVHLVDMIQKAIASYGPGEAMGTKRAGRWVWTTYSELGRRIDDLRGGLASVGVEEDHRLPLGEDQGPWVREPAPLGDGLQPQRLPPPPPVPERGGAAGREGQQPTGADPLDPPWGLGTALRQPLGKLPVHFISNPYQMRLVAVVVALPELVDRSHVRAGLLKGCFDRGDLNLAAETK